jgi:hypothetical protein
VSGSLFATPPSALRLTVSTSNRQVASGLRFFFRLVEQEGLNH